VSLVLWVHINQVRHENLAEPLECLHLRLGGLGLDAEEELFDVTINFLEILILKFFQFSDITVFCADKSEENSK
jgi:hypothetical protein